MANTVKCVEHKQHAEKCDHGAHYSLYSASSMDDIRRIFPEGKANYLNWFVASTSGVHGTYNSLDDIEKAIENPESEEYYNDLTFLIIMPRLVSMTYGEVEVTNKEDVAYLRGLISSSLEEIAKTQKENVTPPTEEKEV